MPYENGVWRPHAWEDWEIDLIDSSLDTVGILDEAAGASISWALYGHGEGSLALHIGSDFAVDLLAAGQWYFRFLRGGIQIRDFMLAKDDRGYTVTTQHVDEYIEISLSPLDLILKDRLCLPENGVGILTTPDLPTDDAFKWIVDHVCGPNAYDGPGGSNRTIAGLTIAADLSADPVTRVITEAHKMDLFAFLQKFGPTWDVDWRVSLAKTTGIANQMVFEAFYPQRGLDKTISNGVRQPVILNDASGEVREARRYRPATGFVNVIISKDQSAEITDAASVALYGRRELLAGTEDEDQLDMVLVDRSQRLGDEINFVESEMMSAGTGELDIQPGDSITIGNHHLEIPARDEMVKEIGFALNDQGDEEAKLTLGRYEKSLGDKMEEKGGGGGGGGGGAGSVFDPIMGLKDDAGTFVPFSGDDDYQYVAITTDGNLTATGNAGINAITISLDDTAVVPETYGDATHVGQFTVDQKGRLISAVEVAIGYVHGHTLT